MTDNTTPTTTTTTSLFIHPFLTTGPAGRLGDSVGAGDHTGRQHPKGGRQALPVAGGGRGKADERQTTTHTERRNKKRSKRTRWHTEGRRKRRTRE